MKNSKLLIILIVFFILITLLTPTIVHADSPITNPEDYNPNGSMSKEDVNKVTEKINPILGTISVIGIVVAVITLLIIGIKYMVGSASEKAEYKRTMIAYIIGIVFLLSTSAVIGFIANLTDEVFTPKELSKSKEIYIIEKV